MVSVARLILSLCIIMVCSRMRVLRWCDRCCLRFRLCVGVPMRVIFDGCGSGSGLSCLVLDSCLFQCRRRYVYVCSVCMCMCVLLCEVGCVCLLCVMVCIRVPWLSAFSVLSVWCMFSVCVVVLSVLLRSGFICVSWFLVCPVFGCLVCVRVSGFRVCMSVYGSCLRSAIGLCVFFGAACVGLCVLPVICVYLYVGVCLGGDACSRHVSIDRCCVAAFRLLPSCVRCMIMSLCYVFGVMCLCWLYRFRFP